MKTIRSFSWWQSPKSKRFFVVVAIWWKGPDGIDTVELLEKGKRNPVILSEPEMTSLIENGELIEVLPEEEPNPY